MVMLAVSPGINLCSGLGADNGVTCAIASGLNDGDVVAVSYNANSEASSADAAESSSDQETSPFAPQGPKRKK